DNSRLQLGAVGPSRSSAAPVTQLANAVAVVGGSSHACVLLGDRTVHCWGDDRLGELGDALGDMTSEPRAVPIEDVVEISSRTDLTTCARTGGGQVYCWGNNSAGQIGNGQVGGVVSTPSRVLGLPGSP
ncbi:MAG: RCC1 repeat-containing protein, partial [Kofleriaceae bacterium]